ncbi:MAG TPA: bifunctional [glutamine synthetase] adenylyltransferase/[glutamine synthetase]-adenylyl-L-tyrosine phosphorylase [Mycobacteriales bacterium]|nr:bifunctional [glutamine synthetase] adenylyltransferase/[glutamine synthetase]-adenylyl-L-tyrosine phosphorylase [Mycobacteriales bacterium]
MSSPEREPAVDQRESSTTGQLARLGFTAPAVAATQLHRLGLEPGADAVVLDELADTADPDLALSALVRLRDAAPDARELMQAVRADDGLRRRLFAVLGLSQALGDHLARHPHDWQVLADEAVAVSRPSRLGLHHTLAAAVGEATGRLAADRLRVVYRRCLLTLAARDLSGDVAVEDVAGELADLAEATLQTALDIARRDHPTDSRLAVIGLGKCGGRELNYVSDVDVVFVAEPADAGATALAAAMMRVCSEVTAEGSIWPVDAALRPEGKAGPLVRTLASHESYYRRWAKTWEFQALLKARAVAGDAELGAGYVDMVSPMVWAAAQRDGFVADVQAMRRRVVEHVPVADVDREVKLGPGGLRDVEFSVQLLQLVHGRSDASLRSPTTLSALEALAAGGYVGRDDAARLAAAYRFLRTVEHRLQLAQLRRTHLLPTGEGELRRLARAMGYRDAASWRRDHDTHTREVRRLHEKLFYRPLLDAVARLPAEEARLTPDAAAARLEALGFVDPAAALRHLEALTRGVSRRAAIQRTLLPVMLGWFADAADPDAGLLAFRQVSEALGSTPWYLRLLRDEGATAERLARLLATSRYVADLLARAPEAVAMLASVEELSPRPAAALQVEFVAAVRRNDDWENAVAVARGLRRRELVRIASGDLLGHSDLRAVGVGLSEVAAATLEAALQTAVRKVEVETRTPLPVRLAVIGMGRLGGGEQGYGSDADVMFVYEPVSGDDTPAYTQVAHDVANELRRLLALPAPDPPLVVDADLRPEGRQGPLVRSLSSYLEYYRRWSAVWEAQALLRARPVAGDAELGSRFVAAIDPVRYPAGGVDAATVREIRRLKARMEAERLPRGADPSLHTKLGRGGLADVEWVVQLLQLRHGADVEALRTPATLPALRAAATAGLIGAEHADVLAESWRLAMRVRNAIVLARGRASDLLPTDPRSLASVARAMGYPAGHTQDLLEDYRRAARRARAVYDEVFFA